MCKASKTVIAALLILLTLVPHASATESPSPRHGTRMIYDPVNQRVLLFGGAKYENRYTFYSDMWAFDTASETWTLVGAEPAEEPPPEGIPGFPMAAVAVSLATVTACALRKRANK